MGFTQLFPSQVWQAQELEKAHAAVDDQFPAWREPLASPVYYGVTEGGRVVASVALQPDHIPEIKRLTWKTTPDLERLLGGLFGELKKAGGDQYMAWMYPSVARYINRRYHATPVTAPVAIMGNRRLYMGWLNQQASSPDHPQSKSTRRCSPCNPSP